MSSFGGYLGGSGECESTHELTGFGTAKVNRTQRSSGNGQAGGGFGNSNTAATATQDDPWATPQATSAGSWGNGPDAEPPF
ncbi:hypothetical protein [Paenarthrobacter sp. TA1.8]|uniref:hypothetical protein n=1 Tax=Paenarthrobacter sp. TA1.8 TaxID=3400219 RepID=UPI003B42F832